ncbi:MAG: FtsX-like permease family protein [Ignavibacteria bacterium]|nr:FtsX-like permease family protein [Ignavibacteria bacterium]
MFGFEILKIALITLKENKLRASLTLAGIVIGVFSIIAIMTLLDALQTGIESGLSQLGSNTFQIQKFPAIQIGGPGSRRRYMNRPDITYEQGLRLIDKATIYKYISLEDWRSGKVFKYGKYTTNPNMYLGGVSKDFLPCNDYYIKEGRYFTDNEINGSAPVTVLGMEVVEKLFPKENPIGKKLILDNNEFRVIGILEAKGESFGQSRDNLALVPITKTQEIYGKADRSINIAVQSTSKDTYDETVEHIIGVMRLIRGVKPGEENNFEIYSNESLINTVNNFTKYFKYGAGVISFISLLAAGIGIMNIMLVSVTERTKEIGIRKSVGAKNRSILTQFLIEAIILCQIGGVIGIFLGILTGNFVGMYLNTVVVIPVNWVIIGFVICSLVGVVFGVYPAYKAAQLNPIDALRYE